MSLATEAVNAMGLLAKNPVSSEDRILVSENAASNLLRLAAQIALEVRFGLEELLSHFSGDAIMLMALVLSSVMASKGICLDSYWLMRDSVRQVLACYMFSGREPQCLVQTLKSILNHK